MERKLLIEEAFLQLRVALLEDDVLVEYRTEELQGKMRAGSVYKGRVCDILPGMQAAFVDIGEDKNAYLAVKDVLDAQNKTIGQALRPGQEVLVQVLREGDDHKGARVSMYLALPGHLMVLRPFETGVGVSKRIADERERSRLKNLVRAHCPKDLAWCCARRPPARPRKRSRGRWMRPGSAGKASSARRRRKARPASCGRKTTCWKSPCAI